MPRRPANMQSADSNRPRAERAIYRDVDHPRHPNRLRCLPNGTPAARIASLPTARTVDREHILGCDKKVMRRVKIVSRVDRRRPDVVGVGCRSQTV